MEEVLPILVFVLVLVGLVAAIGAAVFLIIRVRSGEAVSFPMRLLFRVYLYVISAVSVVILVVGLSSLIEAGLGGVLGKEFSYAPSFSKVVLRPVEPRPQDIERSAPAVVEPTPEEEAQRAEGLDRAFKEGILDGLSSTLVGAVILGLHVWGRRRLEEEDERAGMLNRVYLFLLLAIFGIIALITLPLAINDTLRYYIIDSAEEFSRVRPGGRLAAALVTVPVWAFYLLATLRALRRQEDKATAPGS